MYNEIIHNYLFVGIYSIKPKFQKVLKPLETFLIRNKVHPTVINIMALVLSVIGGFVLYCADKNIWLLLYIPFMAFMRTAFNALDGMVARSLKVKNQEFGEVLNEFFDRISDAAIFLGLAFSVYVDTMLGVFTVGLILLNSYLSIVSKAAGGARQYGGFMGKADRMIYVGAMAVFILVFDDFFVANYFVAFVLVGTAVTMLQRFFSIKKELYR